VTGIGDVEAMAAGLQALLRSPELRRSLGEHGRERAHSMFDPRRMITDHERLYLELVQVPA
jgi:glycosyltransferase involved in cell wall biosynthesis